MSDRVLVITINLYYSKVPSTGTAVFLGSTMPTTAIKYTLFLVFQNDH